MPPKKPNRTPKKVKVTCSGTELKDVDDLEPFQGRFKELSPENYARLKSVLLTLGVTAAATVWKDDGHLWLLDGHQRREALIRMKLEGIEVPLVPVNFATCANKAEARAKVLALSSTYGEVNEEELHQFTLDAGLKLKDLPGSFNFPGIDLEELIKNVTRPTKPTPAKPVPAKAGSSLVHKCPSCGHRFGRGA